MATKESIAMTRDYAVQSLRESGPAIAELLNIDPPDLSFKYRDSDYQQAEELKTIAAFQARVQVALQVNLTQKKKVSNGKT